MACTKSRLFCFEKKSKQKPWETLIISENLSESNTGAVFGIVAYGTYNLTNMATIKDWPSNIVWIDMIWGGTLTSNQLNSRKTANMHSIELQIQNVRILAIVRM